MPKRRWLNQEIVVETAVRLADEAGTADSLTLKQVAAALNVRVPSLYNHVAGADGLREAMTLYGLRLLIQRMRDATFGQVGQEALLAMCHAYRHFAHDHPGIYALTIVAPEPDQPQLQTLAQELLQLLLMAFASLNLAGDDALHAIRGLRAVLHGFVSLEVTGGYKMALDKEESFRRLVDAFVHGLNS